MSSENCHLNKSSILYLEIDVYISRIFPDIQEITYDDNSKKLFYERCNTGLSQLICILDLVKNDDYYQSFIKKSAYLFASISTGHYFPNGNKRLAMMSLTYFLALNKCPWKLVSCERYLIFFKKYFPYYKPTKEDFQNITGWALYNLNKAINFKIPGKTDNDLVFKKTKKVVERFLKISLDINDKY